MQLCFLVIFVLMFKLDFAQTINVNPNPNGNPWTVSLECSNTASCNRPDLIISKNEIPILVEAKIVKGKSI